MKITISKDELISMIDYLSDLRREIYWYKDSGYERYEKEYRELEDFINKLDELLNSLEKRHRQA